MEDPGFLTVLPIITLQSASTTTTAFIPWSTAAARSKKHCRNIGSPPKTKERSRTDVEIHQPPHPTPQHTLHAPGMQGRKQSVCQRGSLGDRATFRTPGMLTPGRGISASPGCFGDVAVFPCHPEKSLQPTAGSLLLWARRGWSERNPVRFLFQLDTQHAPSPLQTPQAQPERAGEPAVRRSWSRIKARRARVGSRGAGIDPPPHAPLRGKPVLQSPEPTARSQDLAFPVGRSERGAGARTRNAHPLWPERNKSSPAKTHPRRISRAP
jgi:hypothetical protein